MRTSGGSDPARAERLAVGGLLAAMCLSAITTLVLSRHLSFYADELDWLVGQQGFAPATLLTPHNSHLVAIPRVIYELLPDLFGTSYLPFRLLEVAGVLACAWFVFVLVRRRAGGPVALLPATILLFFGSSHEIVLSPLGIPIIFAIAFGLAGVAASELATPRRDAAAAGLLALAILCHTFGLVIAGGILVRLLIDPKNRRRAWIAAGPMVLWVTWWLWALKFDQGIVDGSNVPGVPWFMLESAGSALLALTGAGPDYGGRADWLEPVSLGIGVVAAVAAIVLLAARIRRNGTSPALLGFAAMALAFWLSTALSEGPGRGPTSSRYQFFGALVIVLIAAEALRGSELRRRAAVGLAVLFAAGLAGNGVRLLFGAERLDDQVTEVQAQLGMIELAGPAANPAFAPAQNPPRGSQLIAARAGQLLAFSAEVGPLGLSLEEIREQPEEVRGSADFALAKAEGVSGLALPVADVPGSLRCRLVAAGGDGSARIELAPGGSVIRLLDGPAQTLLIGRFGDAASVPAGELSAESALALAVPRDPAPEPWFTSIAGAARVCSRAAGA